MKSIVALLCALSIGLSGISVAVAGVGDKTAAKPPVDCKKDPTNPDCKKKK